jgi:hypothetical protein
MNDIEKDNILLRRRKEKAQATFIGEMLTGLATIALVAFIYFLIYGKYFDIHAVVQSNEAKRHTINIAQVLLSSDRLVYSENIDGSMRYYRGIFDSGKLDEQFVNEDYFSKKETANKEGGLLKDEIVYPNASINLVVTDFENDKIWVLSYGWPGIQGSSELIGCMDEKIDFMSLFNPVNYFASPWSYWDIKECLDNYGSKIGTFENNFPILIRDSVNGELHIARLFARVTEL